MRSIAVLIGVLAAAPAVAVQIPAGTPIAVRLTDKVSSVAPAPAEVHGVVIAPVLVNGAVALPAGTTLVGTVKQARAYSEKERAELELTFTSITDGKAKAPVSAVVASLENSRETLDEKGVIVGIDGASTYGGRLSEGLAKLGANEKLAGLASILQTAKQTLKIQDVNANIEYDAGVELNLKLTQALDWKGSVAGPEAKLTAFPNEGALPALVNSIPYRTQAARPPRPSDMTNLMFIGSEEQVRAAFEKAGWSEAAQLGAQSKLETARAVIENRGYKEGPMSVLLLEGNAPDMNWQKGNNTFAQRHHLRIFRRPESFNGLPVWVCSSTHDTGIEFSDRDRTFIHKVDPEIDRERAKVVTDLIFTGLVKSVALVDRPDVPTSLQNATGDTLQTDGRMAVVLF
jgi:hypothetical protein